MKEIYPSDQENVFIPFANDSNSVEITIDEATIDNDKIFNLNVTNLMIFKKDKVDYDEEDEEGKIPRPKCMAIITEDEEQFNSGVVL